MLQMYNNFTSSPLSDLNFLKAHITVIPKEGKDPLNCSYNGPISLLNRDIKILDKMYSNRLLPHLPALMTLDQGGFIYGRETKDNTTKAVNIIHWLNQIRVKGLLQSTDAAKVFR